MTTETPASATKGIAAPPKTVKRDTLMEIEARMQKYWEESHAFEADAPSDDAEFEEHDKYFVTFPYQLQNQFSLLSFSR